MAVHRVSFDVTLDEAVGSGLRLLAHRRRLERGPWYKRFFTLVDEDAMPSREEMEAHLRPAFEARTARRMEVVADDAGVTASWSDGSRTIRWCDVAAVVRADDAIDIYSQIDSISVPLRAFADEAAAAAFHRYLSDRAA